MEFLGQFIAKIPPLFIYAFVLFFILAVLSRNNFHGEIAFFIFIAITFFLFKAGDDFDYKNAVHITLATAFFIFLVILFSVKYKLTQLPGQKYRIILSFKPIFVTLLFVGSYIFGIKAATLQLPWFTGYILVTISFIIGLILYRKELRFIKTYDIRRS